MLYNLTMRKLLTFIIIFFLLALIVNSITASFESYQRLKELSSGADTLEKLKLKNSVLKKELIEKQTDFFVEQEARNRLGLEKTGDTIVILQNVKIGSSNQKDEQKEKSNLQKWFDLLKI